MSVSSIPELAAGRLGMRVKEEDRGSKGDLILAADCVGAGAIRCMVRRWSFEPSEIGRQPSFRRRQGSHPVLDQCA